MDAVCRGNAGLPLLRYTSRTVVLLFMNIHSRRGAEDRFEKSPTQYLRRASSYREAETVKSGGEKKQKVRAKDRDLTVRRRDSYEKTLPQFTDTRHLLCAYILNDDVPAASSPGQKTRYVITRKQLFPAWRENTLCPNERDRW